MIEIPHAWTNVFHFSSSQQGFDNWSDCKADKHIFLSRATARKQSGARSEKLASPARSLRSPQVAYRHDHEIDLVKAQDMGLNILPNIQLCCCSLRRHSISMYCKSRWTRSDGLAKQDYQKSHRTRQQSKHISVHRVTDRLTQINNKSVSISSGLVLIPFYKLHRKELGKLLQCQKKKVRR